MMKVRWANGLRLAAAVAAVGSAGAVARAATVTWNAPTAISGDSDVQTPGTLVYAYNVGGSGGAKEFNGPAVTDQTVNGVTFQAFDASVADNGGTTATHGSVTISGIDSNFDGAGGYAVPNNSPGTPFTSLSSSYQGLLSQVAFAPSGTTGDNGSADQLTLTLGGLSVGKTYFFETFGEDPRGNQGGSTGTRSDTITGGANTSQTISFNSVPPSDGGLGNYITGTFVADATTQTLTFNGAANGDAQINGFELRDVTPASTTPLPASAMMGVAGLGVLALTRLRRRKAMI